MTARVGIDLVAVDSVRESLDDHAERYLERVFTAQEVRDSRRGASVDPQRLAARFAAKEAALKVLRPGAEGVPWTAIEVRRDVDGSVALELSGTAAMLAATAGLSGFVLSITHEGGYAAAVVLADEDLSIAADRPIMKA